VVEGPHVQGVIEQTWALIQIHKRVVRILVSVDPVYSIADLSRLLNVIVTRVDSLCFFGVILGARRRREEKRPNCYQQAERSDTEAISHDLSPRRLKLVISAREFHDPTALRLHWQTFVICNLSEIDVAKVGSVDRRVAHGARLYIDSVVRDRTVHHRKTSWLAVVACCRGGSEVGCGVALQAEQVDVAVLQHVGVGPTVRDMARRASFQLHRTVWEHEGPLLVLVAVETDGIPVI